MLWWFHERSRPSSPSQLWVAGPLSPYDVIIYLFCIELLLYSKYVTFISVPLFIIYVRLGPSTLGVYFVPGSWCPQNPGVTPTQSQKIWPNSKTLDSIRPTGKHVPIWPNTEHESGTCRVKWPTSRALPESDPTFKHGYPWCRLWAPNSYSKIWNSLEFAWVDLTFGWNFHGLGHVMPDNRIC
jgi:hypothetical protein